MGDPTRAIFVSFIHSLSLFLLTTNPTTNLHQAKEMISIINRDSLLANTTAVGTYVYDHLNAMTQSGRIGENKLLNLRGKDTATFLAFDLITPAKRDEFVGKMRREGVNMGGSGERAVRLRYVVFLTFLFFLFLEGRGQMG